MLAGCCAVPFLTRIGGRLVGLLFKSADEFRDEVPEEYPEELKK